ncbi:MAG: response regulator transcription factor [Pseudomonadota bacterium]
MESKDILVADTDEHRSQLLSELLEKGGFDVRLHTRQAGLLQRVATRPPSMLLLAAQGDSADDKAFGTLRSLKADPATASVHVIVLGDGKANGEAVAALDAGADDYVVRPFSGNELLARMRSCMSRPAAQLSVPRFQAGRLVLDPARHQLFIDDKPVDLSRSMFKLVEFLMSNRNVVHSRATLKRRLWDGESSVSPRTIDVRIRRLRAVLGEYDCESYVQTVRGIGYRFCVESQGERWGSSSANRYSPAARN